MQRRSLITAVALGLVAMGLLDVPMQAAPQEMSRLEQQVRRQLVRLPRLTVYDNIEFRVDGSKVTLLGYVQKGRLYKKAEKAVRRIEGVGEIDNQIVVLPASCGDDRIRQSVFRSIYNFPIFARYRVQRVPPIRIIVNNGHVTLMGVVSSDVEKNAAYSQARGVFTAQSVTNNLHVDSN
jgi:hyperosmotically inducible protein